MVHISGDLDRFNAIRQTWFRSQSEDLGLLLIGGERISENHDHIISSPVKAEGVFATTREGFATALRVFPSAVLFCKFDDDTYVYTYELIRQLKKTIGEIKDTWSEDEYDTENVGTKHPKSPERKYWGYPIIFENNKQMLFGSGGAGYILSREAAKLLISCVPIPGALPYEDAAVGSCMKQSGIDLIDLIGLHPHHPYQMLRWDKKGHPSDRIRQIEPMEGYMNPLTYHYMQPEEMLRMHDDIHLHGFPRKRSTSIPRNIHQFWEGDSNLKPNFWFSKCKEIHPDWKHFEWNNALIKEHFPSNENTVGILIYNKKDGELLNADFYSNAVEKNLLSDIMRYEVLMFFGGVYVDADSECFRPIDNLIDKSIKNAQAVGFYEKDKTFMNGLIASGVIATYAFSPLSVVLVSELQRTDWSLAPWMSAGPLFFTKCLHYFQDKMEFLPEYLDVLILDSFHVYPYHYDDAKPPNIYDALLINGAVMDQKWGTTHGSYRNINQWLSREVVHIKHNLFSQYHPIINHYIQNNHLIGLSTLAKPRPRWVIAALHPLAGLCNRFMHVISTLAFAMATGRVLLFDWVSVPANLHPNQKEYTGHSDFKDLFQELPIRISYSEALDAFKLNEADLGIRVITDDNTDFLNALRWSDLDSKYPESVIRIERYDWWGAPLMHNALYKDFVFQNKSSSSIFSILFRFLFFPKEGMEQRQNTGADEDEGKCDWAIQRRSMWERKTAPVNEFIKCAREHGMNTDQDGNAKNVFISDEELSETNFLKDQPGLFSYVAPTGCRKGIICDMVTLQTMYNFSMCSHAVITHTSTFGACITALGMIGDVYIVNEHGNCVPKAHIDPIDAGALDTQEKIISNLIQYSDLNFHDPTFAFVYIMIDTTDQAIQDFQKSIYNLHKFFNHQYHYPIVIFVDDVKKWQYLQFVASVRVHLIEIDKASQEWTVPDHVKDYPETFHLKSVPEHKGFSIQYRLMSRFAAGYLFSHPSLSRFEYVLKMDSDTEVTASWSKNPLMEMYDKKASLGFWSSHSDTSDVTEGLWPAFVDFVRTRNLKLKQPGLIIDSRGKYRHTNFYGCFIGAKTSMFRSTEYKELFQYFDSLGGFFYHRWDEQKLYVFYAALYLMPSEVEYFDYVSIEHQKWATTPSKIQIEAVSNEILQSIFMYEV